MLKSPDDHLITVLWALPAAPERAKLRALVTEVACQCNAPVFELHLTLGQGGPEALASVHQKSLRLLVAGFDFTEKFTKTLFLRLEMSPDLVALRTALGLPATDDCDPHLSLLYRKMPVARKADLTRPAPRPLATVLFDRLAAVSCPDPTSSRRRRIVENPRNVSAKRSPEILSRHLTPMTHQKLFKVVRNFLCSAVSYFPVSKRPTRDTAHLGKRSAPKQRIIHGNILALDSSKRMNNKHPQPVSIPLFNLVNYFPTW